ncbi:serine aminopeptidase domain-containing protein [Mycobacterium sp. C31M]
MPGDSTAGAPTWFGTAEAALFGVLHCPSGGQSRGGIVLCPPLGKEHVDTYRGLKLLAQKLAVAGFAVMRFDYAGTGDSTGRQGAETAITDYLDSIAVAARYLRDCGVPTVSLIGLRAGALLAAAVAPTLTGSVDLALWDPVTDGRRYLREQRALYRMSVGEDTADTSVESILGLSFSPQASLKLAAMKLPTAFDENIRTLLLVRPERRDDKRLRTLASAPSCTVRAVPDQSAFVEPASYVVEIPYPTVDLLTDWFDTHGATATAPFRADLRSSTVVNQYSDGTAIVETIEHFGPHRLFGIRTAMTGARPDCPTLLTHSTAYEHRIGTGRIWTETARELAALGVTALRYDRRGTGDSGAATEFPRIYSDQSRADIAAAVTATGAGPDRLMMTGVCSGAWHSAMAAITKGAHSVVLVNIIGYALRQKETDPDIAMTTAPQPTLKQRAKSLIRSHIPYPAWLMLGKLGVAQVPEVLLTRLRRRNIRTDILLSPADLTWFSQQHGDRSMQRVSDAGWAPTLIAAPFGDHPLLRRDLQEFTRRHLVGAIRRDFGPLLADAEPDQPSATC